MCKKKKKNIILKGEKLKAFPLRPGKEKDGCLLSLPQDNTCWDYLTRILKTLS